MPSRKPKKPSPRKRRAPSSRAASRLKRVPEAPLPGPIPASLDPVPAQAAPVSLPWFGSFFKFSLFLTLAVGVIAYSKGETQWGLGLILGSAGLFFGERLMSPGGSPFRSWMFFLGWFLMGESLMAVSNYAAAVPQAFQMHFSSPGVFFALGFVLMFLAFRSGPRDPAQEDDWKPWSAGLALTFILACASVMTFSHFEYLYGGYWDDTACIIYNARKTRELHMDSMLMAPSFYEPAFNYITVWLWNFMPNETGRHMMRIVPGLTFVINIWAMYFLGKEVGNRKTGLLAAALGTANMWLTRESLWGYGTNEFAFPATLILLSLFRLFKKPTWSRFFQWAMAGAFGLYTYEAYRPFTLFAVLVVFIWIWVERKDQKTNAWGGTLALSLLVGWVLFMFTRNNLLGQGLIAKTLGQPWFVALALAFLGWVFWKAFQDYQRNRENEIPIKWAGGLFLFLILVYPLVMDQYYAARISLLNVTVPESSYFLGAGWKLLTGLVDKVGGTIHSLFTGGGFFGDSALDFQSAWLIFPGLAAFFARPNWKSLLVFGAVAAGLAPHILSGGVDYDGRALAAAVPFFLLAALGLDQLRLGLRAGWNKPGAVFFGLLFLGFFAWQGWTNYQFIYTKWFFGQAAEHLVSREVYLDSPENRVYLGPAANFVSPSCQGVLNEGHPLYVLHQATNPIYLRPDEKPKNVVVIVCYGDTQLYQRLKTAFPQAQVTNVNAYSFHYLDNIPNDGISFYRFFIPAGQISDKPAVIYFKPVPAYAWTREFYWGSYGLAKGTIFSDDKAVSLRGPMPPLDDPAASFPEVMTAKAEGVFQAPAEGNYTFSAKSQNFVVLSIDHKKVVDLRDWSAEPPLVKGTIHLAPGTHSVELETYFRSGPTFPEVQVLFPGAAQTVELDQCTH